ncbi:hypothetical protein [Glycomyces sp. YM15]|uniref:hypothetical protein n=1 Tax=Glycomyces sp. YM15 TaxID=2800446 RepID=UPI001965079C|nr:hypothetical protein [Glycomyces sp. YM15]
MNEVLKELRELEKFGPRALDLLLDLARSELRRIPELQRDHSKTYDDYALGFFAESGEELLTAVLLQAEDDDAVGRMFHTWLHRWMIDEARKGSRGRLRESLRKRLERDHRFRRGPVPMHWQLVDGLSAVSGVDPADLIDVAWQRHVSYIAPSNADAARLRLGARGELENLLIAVFEAAKGSLSEETLTTVIAVRLPYQVDPTLSVLDVAALPAPAPTTPEMQVIAEVETAQIAEAAVVVYAALTEVERRLVPVIDDQAAASALLGKGRSATYNRLQQLRVKLRELAGSEAAARDILEVVIRRCLEGIESPAIGMDGSASVPSTSLEG